MRVDDEEARMVAHRGGRNEDVPQPSELRPDKNGFCGTFLSVQRQKTGLGVLRRHHAISELRGAGKVQ